MTHMTVRGASPKPKKGTRAREKARAARDKAANLARVCKTVAARDGYVCRVCDSSPPLSAFMDFHHIVFRSQGGKDETSNVVLLCRACHDKVHARVVRISGDADGTLTITQATSGGYAERWLSSPSFLAGGLR